MMKKLPISYPLVTTSPTIAALFSIITDSERYDTWVLNNFNNLLCIVGDDENRCIFMEDQPSNRETIFADINLFRYNRIKYDMLQFLCGNIVEFMIKAIDNGYYVRIALDNFYISFSKAAYHKEHFLHPLLVYGYDTDSRCFFIGEFFEQRKFDFYEITYNCFMEAYHNCSYPEHEVEEYLENIILIKPDMKTQAEEIHIGKIINETKDYLHGTDHTQKYLYRKRKTDSACYYGIECYDHYIQSIGNHCLDNRSAHVFCDRMKLLSFKLEVFHQKHCICEEQYLILKKLVTELQQLSVRSRNLSLKLQIKHKDHVLTLEDRELLISKYRILKLKETEYLTLLLTNL